MSETRDAFGPLLLRLQADMRAVQRQLAMLQAALGELATHLPTREEFQAGLSAIDTQFVDRIAASETAVLARLDQTERSVEERLQRLETGQAEALLLLRRLSTGEGFIPRGAAPSPTPEQPSVIPLPPPK